MNTTTTMNTGAASLSDQHVEQYQAEQAAQSMAKPKRGTDAQILFERKLTCEAINGAMAFGYQNTNPPPSDDHWLAPFWKIGRKQAELEAAIAAGGAQEAVAVASDRIEVDAKALREVLVALNGPGHYIRELQVTRNPLICPDNPINKLTDEFNAWVEAQKATP